MSSFDKYIKANKIYYKNLSEKKENDINRFLNSFIIIEKLGENGLININHNEQEYRKDDYLWFMYNQKILEKRILEEGGYSTIFLTLTLPSSFHRYSKTTKKYNNKFVEDNTIEKGYQLLNESFRTIYKNFRVNRKHQKIYYCKVFEPHSNFTPHLHSILYVKSELKEALIQHIKNTIKKNSLGQSFDIEEVKDLTRSSSYLLKYVRKNTNAKDKDSFRVFNGWKKAHKIRVFTCSILSGLERFLYKKLKNNTNVTRNLKENPITKILNECNINITTTCKTTNEIKIKSNKVENPKFSIIVKKERVQLKDKKEVDSVKSFIEFLRNDYFYCTKFNKKYEETLFEDIKFCNLVIKTFGINSKNQNLIYEYHSKFFSVNHSNMNNYFKDFELALLGCIKDIHRYRVVDIEIFEHKNNEIIKNYDKKDFFITNASKKQSQIKRIVWEIKEERYIKNINS